MTWETLVEVSVRRKRFYGRWMWPGNSTLSWSSAPPAFWFQLRQVNLVHFDRFDWGTTISRCSRELHCVRGQFHGAHALLCLASTRNSRLPLRKRLFNALLPIGNPAKLTNPVWECFLSKQHHMIISVCVWLTVTPALQQTYNFTNCVSWLRASERCLKFNWNSVKYGNTLCLFYHDMFAQCNTGECTMTPNSWVKLCFISCNSTDAQADMAFPPFDGLLQSLLVW